MNLDNPFIGFMGGGEYSHIKTYWDGLVFFHKRSLNMGPFFSPKFPIFLGVTMQTHNYFENGPIF